MSSQKNVYFEDWFHNFLIDFSQKILFGIAFGLLDDDLTDFLELVLKEKEKEKLNSDLIIVGLDARTGN